MQGYMTISIPKEMYDKMCLACNDPEKFLIEAINKLIDVCPVD